MSATPLIEKAIFTVSSVGKFIHTAVIVASLLMVLTGIPDTYGTAVILPDAAGDRRQQIYADLTHPPENCHLNVKKIAKNLRFFIKKLAKIVI